MTRYETDIDISATPDVVWRTLTHDMPQSPSAYGIVRLQGQIAAHARIKLWSEVSPKRAFHLTVVAFEPSVKMVWRGGMPFGLFTGTRTFALSAQPQGGCRFAMQEVFSGPLSGLITRSIPDLTPSFETFAQTLKARAEAQ